MSRTIAIVTATGSRGKIGSPMKWKTLMADLDEAKDRKRLRSRIQRLLNKWQPILGVHLDAWDLRQMKLYWGSARRPGCDGAVCRPGHITFNSEMGKLPPRYQEYIVVHELVHQLTDGHDKRFYQLMDQHLPGWRKMQAHIEAPLERYS